MVKNRKWTKDELNQQCRLYCGQLIARVKHNRRRNFNHHDMWDIPKVAVTCASGASPYICVCGKNGITLKNPHETLRQEYPSVKHERNAPTYPGEPHYEEGHCAEPHAAHKLLNRMDEVGVPISIYDIEFSNALSVKNNMVKPYCATCKLTFKQLR